MDKLNTSRILMLYDDKNESSGSAQTVNERLPRYFAEDQPQHVIQRGNNRDVTFVHEDDYLFYLECLAEAAVKHQLNIHAYVLMSNHVHLLATPATSESLPKTMQSVGRRYVQYFNYSYQRTGTLWEGRYKATVIDSDRYFLACSRYIELNPVRAGMVSSPDKYRWSSYSANALGQRNALLTFHDLYLRLGPDDVTRQNAYQALFNKPLLDSELEEIRQSTNKGWALGNQKFRDRIESLTQRRSEPLSKGRPKKKSRENRV